MRPTLSAMTLAFTLSFASCQQSTLHSYYANIGERYRYELFMHKQTSTFSFYASGAGGVHELPGTFLIRKNTLFLLPYWGRHAKISSANDSRIVIKVFDGENGSPLNTFHLRSLSASFDSLVLEHQATLPDSALAGEHMVISSLSGPYMFIPDGPGEYWFFLYKNNFNRDILTYKIRKDKLVSVNKLDLYPTELSY